MLSQLLANLTDEQKRRISYDNIAQRSMEIYGVNMQTPIGPDQYNPWVAQTQSIKNKFYPDNLGFEGITNQSFESMGIADKSMARTFFDGSIRMLTQGLQPLQMPKDVMDAIVAGGLDPNTTIAERLSRLNWKSYIPIYSFTQETPRATTGKEILDLMGVKNKIAQSWGGFVYDVAADPLLAAGMLKSSATILSKLAGAGKLAQGAEVTNSVINASRILDKMGDGLEVMNRFVNPFTAPTSVARLSPEVRNLMDGMSNEIIKFVMSPERSFNKGLRTLTDNLLPAKTSMGLKFGDKKVIVDGQERTINFGNILFDLRGQAFEKGGDFAEEQFTNLLNAQAKLLGVETKGNFTKEALKVIREIPQAEKSLQGMPQLLYTSINTNAFKVGRGVGVAAIPEVADPIVSEVQRIGKPYVNQMLADDVMNKAINDVRNAAIKSNYDPQEAVSRFVDYTHTIIAANAKIGYMASGGEIIKQRLVNQMSQLGATGQEAQRVFEQVFAAGMKGDNFQNYLNMPTSIKLLNRVVTDNAAVQSSRQAYRSFLERTSNDLETIRNGLVENHLNMLDSLRTKYISDLRKSAQGKVDVQGALDNALRDEQLAYQDLTNYAREAAKSQNQVRRATYRNELVNGQAGQDVQAYIDIRNKTIDEKLAQVTKANDSFQQGITSISSQLNGAERGAIVDLNSAIGDLAYYASEAKRLDYTGTKEYLRQRGRAIGAVKDARNNMLKILNDSRTQLGSLRAQDKEVLQKYLDGVDASLKEFDTMSVGIIRDARAKALAAATNTPELGYNPQVLTQLRDNYRAAKDYTTQLTKDRGTLSNVTQSVTNQYNSDLLGLSRNFDNELAQFDIKYNKTLANRRTAFLKEQASIKDGGSPIQNIHNESQAAQNIIEARRASGMNESVIHDTPVTIKEIFDGIQEFSPLDFASYANGVVKGHLRNTYGIFTTVGDASKWVEAVQGGTIVPNSVLDERAIVQGIGGKEGQLISDYVTTVAGDGKAIINKYELVRHLIDNGVTPQKARDSVADLIAHINPALQDYAKELKAVAGRYDNPRTELYGIPIVASGRSAYKELQDLDQKFMEKLGVMASPTQSIIESANIARKHIPIQQFMSDAYNSARQYGYATTAYRDGFVKLDDAAQWGAFANKWVHPYLKNELLIAMKAPQVRFQAAKRILNLVSGGYLAGTNIMVANIAGGIYTAGAAGITPERFIPKLIQHFGNMLRYYHTGQSFEALDTLRTRIPLKMSSQVSNQVSKEMKNFRLLQAGTQGTSAEKLFDDTMSALESQINAPGFGNLRAWWAGLEGFQFWENLMKVAAFDAEREYLKVFKGMDNANSLANAAEKARVAVFDYSELPHSLAMLRDTGVVMYPGYTYFSLGRTLTGVIKQPGFVGAAERLPDAIMNAKLSEEEKYATFAALDDWMKEGKSVPIKVRQGPAGETRVVTIPLAQLVPTNAFANRSWLETVSTGGIYRPIMEAIWANITGSGEAPFSSKYGKQVFDAGATGWQRLEQSAEFILDSLSPSNVRKAGLTAQDVGNMFRGDNSGGLIGSLRANWSYLPDEFAQLVANYDEVERSRPSRSFSDEVLAATLRSPAVIALGGPVANVDYRYQQSKRDWYAQTLTLRKKIERLVNTGHLDEAQQFQEELQTKAQDFLKTWGSVQDVYDEYRASELADPRYGNPAPQNDGLIQ